MRRRGRCQHIGDEAFIPAADFVVFLPAMVGGPVPVEHFAPALRVPIPLDFMPELGDATTNGALFGRVIGEILPSGEQALDEE